MLKKFSRKLPIPARVLWFLVVIGLVILTYWRVNQISIAPNLLTNPDFERPDFSGWQIVTSGQARANLKQFVDNTVLELNIPQGSGAGVGQHLPVSPGQRYQLKANYRFVNQAQTSPQLLIQLSQFNQAGQLIKRDEILNSVSSPPLPGRSDWHVLTHHLVTDEQAAAVEIGLGFLGDQTVTVEIDDLVFQVYTTWLITITHDALASSLVLLLLLIIGYKLGQVLWLDLGLKPIVNKKDGLIISLLILLVVLLFGPVIYLQLKYIDYNDHILFAQIMADTGVFTLSHFLYHLLVIIVQAWFGLNFSLSAFVIALACYVFLGVVLYYFIRSALETPPSFRTSLICLFITLSLMLIAPVTLFTWDDHHLYFGYIVVNAYHNPTIVLLKPLALLLFLYTVKIFSNEARCNFKTMPTIFIFGILILLSTLAKPSYIIALLPTLILWFFYRRYRQGSLLGWPLMIFGIVLPATIVLSWQYYLFFMSDSALTHEAQITVMPFEFMRYHSSWLLAKFILSILFPLCIYFLYFKKVIQNVYVNLSWVVFGIGAFYTYFLVETGPRMTHGNFVWSGQISLFILLVVSTMFFMQQNLPLILGQGFRILDKRFWVGVSVFGLHLVSGIFWYYVHLIGPGYEWW